MAVPASADDNRTQQFRETASTLGKMRGAPKSVQASAGVERDESGKRRTRVSGARNLNGDTAEEVLARKSGLFQVSEDKAEGEASAENTQARQERAVEQFGQAMDEAFVGPGEKSWFDSAYDSVADAAGGLWDGTKAAWDSVSDKFTSLWEDTKNSIADAADYVGDQVNSAYEAVMPEGARNFISNAMDTVTTAATNAWTVTKEFGSNIVETTSKTATNAWDATTDYVSGKFTSAKNWLFGSSEPQAANTNTAPATPTTVAPVPEVKPLVGSENDIEMKSGKSITAQFRQATTAPEADNSNDPEIAPSQAPISAPAARANTFQ